MLGSPKPSAGSVLKDIDLLREAGISMCSVWMPVAPPHLAAGLEWIAEEILPELGETSAEKVEK